MDLFNERDNMYDKIIKLIKNNYIINIDFTIYIIEIIVPINASS